jgi:hypothetical protein
MKLAEHSAHRIARLNTRMSKSLCAKQFRAAEDRPIALERQNKKTAGNHESMPSLTRRKSQHDHESWK